MSYVRYVFTVAGLICLVIGVVVMAYGLKAGDTIDLAVAGKGFGLFALGCLVIVIIRLVGKAASPAAKRQAGPVAAPRRRTRQDQVRPAPRLGQEPAGLGHPEAEAFLADNGVEAAYALGLADLTTSRSLGQWPAGLLFLMPYAVAAARSGVFSQRETWPSYEELDPAERQAVALIHRCLTGSAKDVDAVIETVLGGVLFEPMYILFRENERFWGLKAGKVDVSVFERLYGSGKRRNSPSLYDRSRLDDDAFDASARASAVRIVRAVADYGSAPDKSGTKDVRTEIETAFPTLVVARKPRQASSSWHGAASWFGGRPKLGDKAWPRTEADNKPMYFLAQIDLAEVARQSGSSLLPTRGSLAFFVGWSDYLAGRAIHVDEDSALEWTPTPDDAPPVFDALTGSFFVETADLDPPRQFPYWPVDIVAMDHAYDASRDEQVEAVERRFARREFFFSSEQAWERTGADANVFWWHGACHLAACLRLASRSTGGVLDAKRRYIKGDAKKQAAFDALEQSLPAFQRFVDEVGEWVAGHPLWQAMSPEEMRTFEERHARARTEYPEFTRYHVPRALKDIQTETLLALAMADDEGYATMPEAVGRLIDEAYLLPTHAWHQMFGKGIEVQGNAAETYAGHHMLLQLVYDDMMHWRFGDMGAFQFWISPADLKCGNWNGVTVSFESH